MNSTDTNHPLLAKGKLTKLSHRCTALNISRCFKRDQHAAQRRPFLAQNRKEFHLLKYKRTFYKPTVSLLLVRRGVYPSIFLTHTPLPLSPASSERDTRLSCCSRTSPRALPQPRCPHPPAPTDPTFSLPPALLRATPPLPLSPNNRLP